MVVMSLGIYFVYQTQMTWNKRTMKQYHADFPWTEDKEVFCFTSSVSWVHEVLSGIWNPLISGQIVNSFGQGKCTFNWLLVWEFQKLFLWQPCFNKPMHVENWETDHLQPDLYVDISNKFTLVWVFVSHACTQITVNTFINNLVLFTGIIQC